MTISRLTVSKEIETWATEAQHEFTNKEELSLSLLMHKLIENSYNEGYEDGLVERNES